MGGSRRGLLCANDQPGHGNDMLDGKKIVVVLPAYNAAKTLEWTYGEIPFAIVDDVILVDEAQLPDRLHDVCVPGIPEGFVGHLGDGPPIAVGHGGDPPRRDPAAGVEQPLMDVCALLSICLSGRERGEPGVDIGELRCVGF